jgi:hypothetical protein
MRSRATWSPSPGRLGSSSSLVSASVGGDTGGERGARCRRQEARDTPPPPPPPPAAAASAGAGPGDGASPGAGSGAGTWGAPSAGTEGPGGAGSWGTYGATPAAPVGMWPAPPRTFWEAIKVCLTKYVDGKGRASRSEYWYFALFSFLVGLATGGVGDILLFLPSITVSVRRLHDIGKSAWALLWILLPSSAGSC